MLRLGFRLCVWRSGSRCGVGTRVGMVRHGAGTGHMHNYARTDYGPSMYLMVGSLAHVKLLVLLHGMVGVMLIFGVQTQVVSVVAWWLHRSLGMRAPFLLAKDGELAELMLLWGTVLPIGAVWSADRWHGARLPGRSPGLLTDAIMWLFDPDGEADDARSVHTTTSSSSTSTSSTGARKAVSSRPDSVWADRSPNGRAKQQPRVVTSSAPSSGPAVVPASRSTEYISTAAVGIHFQAFFLYIVAGVLKNGADW